MSGDVKNFTNCIIRIFFIFILSIIIGCSSDSLIDELADGGSETGNPPSETELVGYAQKGPFALETDVTVQLLQDFVPTEKLVVLETDEFGNYTSSSIKIPGDYIELIADGFYFDEISGTMSENKLILKSWSDVEEENRININVLTTLAKERIATLISTGMNFNDAAEQARAEVLDIFGIDDMSATRFKNMNMMEAGNANGILLAVSAILMQAAHNVPGGESITDKLERILDDIHNDIRPDGILDNVDLINQIENATMTVDTAVVRTNMETQYPAYVIPPFEQYILGDLNIHWTGSDYTAKGVTFVETIIYDSETGTIYNELWPCNDAEGTVIGLNEGVYDLVTINFLNEFESVVFRAEKTDVSIIAGQTSTLNIDSDSFVTGDASIEWVSDCANNSIASIQAIVYDSLGNELQTAGPWGCDDDIGPIFDIPDMTDGSIILVLSDLNGDEISRAKLTGIDVTSGETTNIGALEIILPKIIQPDNGDTNQVGNTLSFEGTGSDLQGNSLSGADLIWTSDVNGQIGTGESFDFADLSYGQHTITLTALDSIYGSISTSIIVHIEYTGAIIYVGPSETYTTIQDAVDDAAAYSRIIVRDGTYIENVDISKVLSIESENGFNKTTVIAADSNDHVFSVIADWVKIEGFTIFGAKGHGVAGILIYNTNNCIVTNNYFGIDSINFNDIGIYIHSSDNHIISNNLCYYNERYGISLYKSDNITVSGNTCDSNSCNIVIGGDNHLILNNTVSNGYRGIKLSAANNCTVSGNIASQNGYRGIGILNSNNNIVSNNICQTNVHGINAMGTSVNNQILNNTCNSNTSNGVYVSGSANANTVSGNTCLSNEINGISVETDSNIISDNTCSFNLSGIGLSSANTNIISENLCSENNTGIWVGEVDTYNNTIKNNTITLNPDRGVFIGSGNNTLYLNTFNNTENVYSMATDANTWNSPTEITYTYEGSDYTGFLGNYYADHDLTDSSGDGVTDNPYDLSGIEPDDMYPLVDTMDNYE